MMAVCETVEHLNLLISSNVTSVVAEKHYLSTTTVAELKVSGYLGTGVHENTVIVPLPFMQGKLELVTGASAETVQLQLLNSDQQLVCELNDDLKTLEFYTVKSGMTIHVRQCMCVCVRACADVCMICIIMYNAVTRFVSLKGCRQRS